MRPEAACSVLLCLLAMTLGCITLAFEVTGKEKERILGHVDPIADNIFEAFNENNYSAYSRDFSYTMRKALDEEDFAELRQFLSERIGTYKSRRDATVMRHGRYVSVIYKADFEKEVGVLMRVIFGVDDVTYEVEGLWYDSPRLRE